MDSYYRIVVAHSLGDMVHCFRAGSTLCVRLVGFKAGSTQTAETLRRCKSDYHEGRMLMRMPKAQI